MRYLRDWDALLATLLEMPSSTQAEAGDSKGLEQNAEHWRD